MPRQTKTVSKVPFVIYVDKKPNQVNKIVTEFPKKEMKRLCSMLR